MAEDVNEGEAAGEVSVAQEPVHDLDMIRNISDFEKGILFSAGYDRLESLKDTTAEEFRKLKGITEDRAQELYDDIQQFFLDLEEKRLKEREKVRDFLYSLPGVSKAVAERIYDSGYDTFDALKQASEEELMRIRGVGRFLAKNITEGMEKRLERFEEGRPVSAPEESEVEAEPETKAEGGLLKGFMDKITGFLFKKDVTKTKAQPEEGAEEGLEEEKTEFIEGTEEEELPEPEDGAEEALEHMKEALAEGEPGEEKEVAEAGMEGAEEAGKEGEEKKEIEEARPGDEAVTPPTEEVEAKGEEAEAEEEVKEEDSEEAQYPTVSAMAEGGRSKAVEEFMQIEGIDEEIAQALYDTGYNSLDELAPALAEDFTYVKGVDEAKAEMIHRNVQEYFEDKGE